MPRRLLPRSAQVHVVMKGSTSAMQMTAVWLYIELFDLAHMKTHF